MKCLRKNIQYKWIFYHAPDDNDYIAGIYMNSEWEPDDAEQSIEERIDNFEASPQREQREYNRKCIWPNLTPM